MKTSRQIYDEILSDGTFRAMLNDNIRRTEAMKRADRNYASRRRQDLIKSVENSLFLSSWAASGYGKFWDEGIYDWLDSLWLQEPEDGEIRDIHERQLKTDMAQFLLAYFEVTECLSKPQQPKAAAFSDFLTASGMRRQTEIEEVIRPLLQGQKGKGAAMVLNALLHKRYIHLEQGDTQRIIDVLNRDFGAKISSKQAVNTYLNYSCEIMLKREFQSVLDQLP